MKFQKLTPLQTDASNPQSLKRTVDMLYGFIQKNLDAISSEEVINGNLLKQVSLTINKDNLVPHKLGRSYTNFTVYQNNTGVNVWLSDTPNNQKDKFIILTASNDVVADLWII